MRRQKCDRKDPCTRCVQNNEAATCSRKWQDGYDPRVHRMYPKARALQSPENTTRPGSPVSIGEEVARKGAQDPSLVTNAATSQRPFPSEPTYHDLANINRSQPFLSIPLETNIRRSLPDSSPFCRVRDKPTSSGFPADEGFDKSNTLICNVPSIMDSLAGAEGVANGTGHAYAGICPSKLSNNNFKV